MFIALVPRLLAFYHNHAVKLTEWENHPRQSSYDRSLTLKTFALGSIVAYGGLALSAFVYVPFGSQIMRLVQSSISEPVLDPSLDGKSSAGMFKLDKSGITGESIIQSMKGERLRNQVFAYTVTNQIINFVLEVIVPWVTESVNKVKSKGKLGGKKKRVEWEDEASASQMSKEDRALLDAARTEASLPDYELFGRISSAFYSINHYLTLTGGLSKWNEQVIIMRWSCSSAILPYGALAGRWLLVSCLANLSIALSDSLDPVMALINNWIELRSDAFKIAKLGRRPLSSRTDSIGAWLSALVSYSTNHITSRPHSDIPLHLARAS